MIAQPEPICNGKLPSKPKPIDYHFDNIPLELKKLRRWVLWRYEWKHGGWTKVPYNPNVVFDAADEHKEAKANKPSTWSSYDRTLAIYQAHRRELAGIGFELLGSGYCAFDGDNTSGTTREATLLESFSGTYCERSPSGKGIRAIGRGKLPGDKGRKRDGLELSANGQFVTLTGHRLSNHSDITDVQPVIDQLLSTHFADPDKPKVSTTKFELNLKDQEILDLLRVAKNADRFEALYGADTRQLCSDFGYSQKADGSLDNSAVDLALCNMFAFYTSDSTQVDRLFRSSNLNRDKWDRADYRERTIEKALETVCDKYTPPAST